MLAFTPPGASTASVLLRATVRDSAIIPGSGDAAPGDIRNATVTFREGATALCGPVPVGLINGQLTIGTASCTATLGVGAHVVTIVVGNYYTFTATTLVEVAEPSGSFITGGGSHVIGTSAGTYRAETGSLMEFAFNVNYTRNFKNLQGHASVQFTRNGRTYELRSTAIDSLGIVFQSASGAACSGPSSSTCFGTANLRAKARLIDISDRSTPILLSNLTLQITVTDKGEPGSSDTIGVTAWNGNTLVFSSEWNGTTTVEGLLDGGNIVVH
jgi:hypothetical protein